MKFPALKLEKRANLLLLVVGIILEAGYLALIGLGNLTANSGHYFALFLGLFLLF